MSYMHNSTPVIHVLFTLPHCLCHLFLSLPIPPLFVYSQPFSNAFVLIRPLFVPSFFSPSFLGFIAHPKQLSHPLPARIKLWFVPDFDLKL